MADTHVLASAVLVCKIAMTGDDHGPFLPYKVELRRAVAAGSSSSRKAHQHQQPDTHMPPFSLTFTRDEGNAMMMETRSFGLPANPTVKTSTHKGTPLLVIEAGGTTISLKYTSATGLQHWIDLLGVEAEAASNSTKLSALSSWFTSSSKKGQQQQQQQQQQLSSSHPTPSPAADRHSRVSSVPLSALLQKRSDGVLNDQKKATMSLESTGERGGRRRSQSVDASDEDQERLMRQAAAAVSEQPKSLLQKRAGAQVGKYSVSLDHAPPQLPPPRFSASQSREIASQQRFQEVVTHIQKRTPSMDAPPPVPLRLSYTAGDTLNTRSSVDDLYEQIDGFCPEEPFTRSRSVAPPVPVLGDPQRRPAPISEDTGLATSHSARLSAATESDRTPHVHDPSPRPYGSRVSARPGGEASSGSGRIETDL